VLIVDAGQDATEEYRGRTGRFDDTDDADADLCCECGSNGGYEAMSVNAVSLTGGGLDLVEGVTGVELSKG
jgi:hypothetical protein